jgi:AbrB family looped-hinge helix DNA binding protein
MVSAIAKITSKSQTTIPREIRAALHVEPGDSIIWEVDESGHVEVRRARPLDVEFLRGLESTLSEWDSPEDDEAYRDL